MHDKSICKIACLITVLGFSAFYTSSFIDRGWVPHDDGSLAQMAERVLTGELPHRDFDEIYTGGLSFLYAGAFKLFGTNLLSIRVTLFAFFLAFVPAFYAIALRLASPAIAAAVTMLGVVWSLPNYFAGMPSWYNLFFAAFGTLAVIRHIETNKRKWLFTAGLCGGVSFLVKLTGLYYLVAVLLFLTYREQILSGVGARTRDKSFAFFVLTAFIYVFFIVSLITLMRSRLEPMEIFHFLLPIMAISAILLWSQWREGHGRFAVRFNRLLKLLLPFVSGVAIPIALFLVPYTLSGSVGDFYHGVFVLSQRRLQYARWDFPHFLTVAPSLPYAALLLFPFSSTRTPLDRIVEVFLLVLLGLALIESTSFDVYQLVWRSASSLSVIAVLTGCLIMARAVRGDVASQNKHQILFLLVITSGLLSLVQFPFAAPVYFCYVAPVVALTLLAVVRLQPNAPSFLHLGILAFYFLFALLRTNTEHVWDLGVRYSAYEPTRLLESDRGRIRVNDADVRLYSHLLNLIREKSSSSYIYAAPDCPEVYFLSGVRNPTRKIFDFLGDSDDEAEVSALLEKSLVKTAVINRNPHFSGKLDPKISGLLEKKLPQSRDLGQFIVRWKE